MFSFCGCEFAGSKEAGVCDAACCVDGSVSSRDTGVEFCEHGSEDREGNGLNRLPIFFTMKDLDATDKAGDDGGFASCEW